MGTRNERLGRAARILQSSTFLDPASAGAAAPIHPGPAKATAKVEVQSVAAVTTAAPSFACLARYDRWNIGIHWYQLRSWSSSRVRRSPSESNVEFFQRCS